MPPRSPRGQAGKGATDKTRFYFAGEVLDLVGVRGRLSYRQLARLGEMIARVGGGDISHEGAEAGTRRWSWARYELDDIARLVVVLELCGGRGAFEVPSTRQRRRLRSLEPIEKACEALRSPPYMLTDPLLQVRLVRVGSAVAAIDASGIYDPRSKQQIIAMPDQPTPTISQEIRRTNPNLARLLELKRKY